MRWKTLALVLVLAGWAAERYHRRRSLQAFDPADEPGLPGVEGTGAEAENAGERAAHALAAGSALAREADDDWFESSSRRGAQSAAPGLGDFTRGA